MMVTNDERIIEQVQTTNNPSALETSILEPEVNDNELSEPSVSISILFLTYKKIHRLCL